MTKEEIINDTIAYYNEDPSRRATLGNSTNCVYRTKEGKNCAFGRYMKDKYLQLPICNDILMIDELIQDIEEVENINDLLVEKVHGHSNSKFWLSVQNLHDEPYHWNENGYTKELVSKVKALSEHYNIDKQQINVL